ncbi:unnamed protein product [Phaeothamnion confervicola]
MHSSAAAVASMLPSWPWQRPDAAAAATPPALMPSPPSMPAVAAGITAASGEAVFCGRDAGPSIGGNGAGAGAAALSLLPSSGRFDAGVVWATREPMARTISLQRPGVLPAAGGPTSASEVVAAAPGDDGGGGGAHAVDLAATAVAVTAAVGAASPSRPFPQAQPVESATATPYSMAGPTAELSAGTAVAAQMAAVTMHSAAPALLAAPTAGVGDVADIDNATTGAGAATAALAPDVDAGAVLATTAAAAAAAAAATAAAQAQLNRALGQGLCSSEEAARLATLEPAVLERQLRALAVMADQEEPESNGGSQFGDSGAGAAVAAAAASTAVGGDDREDGLGGRGVVAWGLGAAGLAVGALLTIRARSPAVPRGAPRRGGMPLIGAGQ